MAGECRHGSQLGQCPQQLSRGCPDWDAEVARRAVDEALGPVGAGPFSPTYRVEGGSTRPVIHSEEAAIDRDQE